MAAVKLSSFAATRRHFKEEWLAKRDEVVAFGHRHGTTKQSLQQSKSCHD
jgi:hypothetical protein